MDLLEATEALSPKAINYDEPAYAYSPHTVSNYRAGYERMWRDLKITNAKAADSAARLVLSHKATYVEAERLTGVPWFAIGLQHHRECNCNMRGVLHNGQLIIGTGRRTTIVPKGRGPFSTFLESAKDALRGYAAKLWDIAQIAFTNEAFNGFGYRSHGIPSPYLVGGSNLQKRGKYVSDGVYSSSAWDTQIGTLTILKRLCELDADVVKRVGAPAPVVKPEAPKVAPKAPASKKPVPHKGKAATTGAVVATAAHSAGISPLVYVPVILGVLVLAYVATLVFRALKK